MIRVLPWNYGGSSWYILNRYFITSRRVHSNNTPSLRVGRVITFIFENTVIYLNYQLIESQTGDQLILIRFKNASPGIWRFNVYGQGFGYRISYMVTYGKFYNTETYFIQPNIYTTVLAPGTSTSHYRYYLQSS